MALDIGDKVTWYSQAGGWTRQKTGTVVAVLPPGNPLLNPDIDALRTLHDAKEAFGGGLGARKHESYVVLVAAQSSRARPTLYWPVVSKLQKVEA